MHPTLGWADARSPTRQARDREKYTLLNDILLRFKSAAQPTKAQPTHKPNKKGP